MATLILYLRSNWHVCIAVISRFVWYVILVFNALTRYGRLDTAKSLDKEVSTDTPGLTQFK